MRYEWYFSSVHSAMLHMTELVIEIMQYATLCLIIKLHLHLNSHVTEKGCASS